MSRGLKIATAIAAIMFVCMFLTLMAGGAMLRTRAIHSSSFSAPFHLGDGTNGAPAGETIVEGAETIQPFTHDHSHGFVRFHGMAGGPAFRGGFPFGGIGGPFRLVAMGLLIYFGVRLLLRRKGGLGGGRVVHDSADAGNSDDLEHDIRVGDEISRPPAGNMVDIDNMTVDDLLHAMKRLGIKKLEL